MIRLTRMSGTWYGIEMSDDDEFEMEEIRSLVDQGTNVIIVNDADDLVDYGIFVEVEMVKQD